MRALVTVACAVTFAVGCGGGEEEAQLAEPTLASIQANVFDTSCSSGDCHDAVSPKAGLDLSSAAASHASLVNTEAVTTTNVRLLIVPFEPENSYLVNKLRDFDIESNSEYPITKAMPALDELLVPENIAVIEEWISLGCPQ